MKNECVENENIRLTTVERINLEQFFVQSNPLVILQNDTY